MKYRLINEDYEHLYPYLSPDEIKGEFSDMSKSPRWIQEFYKKQGFVPWREGIRELLKRAYDVADTSVDEDQWMQFVYEKLSEIRRSKVNDIWNRAKQYEALY